METLSETLSETPPDRRVFLRTTVGGAALFALWSSGCNDKGDDSGSAGKNPHTTPPKKTLVFNDGAQFYLDLDDALATSKEVTVNFDGVNRIGRESKMVEYLGAASNSQEVYDALIEKDTADGRPQLKRCFRDDILEHQYTRTELKTPNGQVIEPGTIILIVAFLLISAAASVAHAESARGRRYRIKIVGPNNLFALIFEGE